MQNNGRIPLNPQGFVYVTPPLETNEIIPIRVCLNVLMSILSCCLLVFFIKLFFIGVGVDFSLFFALVTFLILVFRRGGGFGKVRYGVLFAWFVGVGWCFFNFLFV